MVEFQIRECGFYESSMDASMVGANLHKTTIFTRQVTLPQYAMDLTPVTNAQFAQFLQASRYRPRHPHNFLRHWVNGAPPAGRENHPVVYVDLDDARAYARWAGRRLPTEEEWQYAAEGPGHTRFPWGEEMRTNVCNDETTGGTTDVMRYPGGRSPFGCYDLCGNVWHWTESERSDGRTRFCILKGGGWFKARGSAWYADGGPLPCRFAAKFLLMWPGLDRCSTVGFRCVVDLAEG
jgi:formylglycine-generating enzyme required for sulfatase activity